MENETPVNPLAQSIWTNEFENAQTPEPQVDPNETPSFAKDVFGIDDPSQILELVGDDPKNPDKVRYKFLGDGKTYAVNKDLDTAQVLEKIWDHNSPGLWGAAKAQTLYGIPADLSSAVAYGLGGLNLDESSEDWRKWSDATRDEYNKKYGQFMVPTAQAAWNQGKLYDYALQTIGAGTPYLGLALTGGALGGAAAAGAGATSALATGVGSFVGATTVTSPIFVAQFADRQVAEMKAAGLENPEANIDWPKALGLGVAASGLNAVPIEAIFYGGPVLNTLKSWGVDLGTNYSARMLGSIADVAGSNAFASVGTSVLSRLNADMPLLDDQAKAEYLDATAAGTLIGLPFGLYRGFRPPSHLLARSLDKTLNDESDDGTVELKPRGPNDYGFTVYGQDRSEPQKLIGRDHLINDPDNDYGIRTVNEGLDYLNSINYKDEKGKERNGLNDFISKFGTEYSDNDVLDTARRVKRVRETQDYVKANNGVLWKTLDDLPQSHSNSPEILTKAAKLVDEFGYDPAIIKGLSDTTLTKLFAMKLKNTLKKVPGAENMKLKVFEETLKAVDEKVMEDHKQYGSIYRRPATLDIHEQLVKGRQESISNNPRTRMAEALMQAEKNKQRESLKAKAEQMAKDRLRGSEVIHQPDMSVPPRYAKSPEGKFYDQFVGAPREPLGPRALLEHKPATRVDEANNVDLLDGVLPKTIAEKMQEGIARPDEKISEELNKGDFVDFLENTPLFQRLFKDRREIFKTINKAEKTKTEKKENSPTNTSNNNSSKQFRYQGETPSDKKPTKPQRVKSKLEQIRDDLEKMHADKNNKTLKDNPALGQALDDIVKAMGETHGKAEIGNGTSRTKASTSSKNKEGFWENVSKRERLLNILENAIKRINPKSNIGKEFRSFFESALSGGELGTQDLANLSSLFQLSFHLDHVDRNIGPTEVSNLYRALRAYLPHKLIQALDNNKRVVETWYNQSHGLSLEDGKLFRADEIEAAAFYSYLSGEFKPNWKEFKDSKHKEVFTSFERVLKQINKEFKDQGIHDPSDIFEFNKSSNERVPPGEQTTTFNERVSRDTNVDSKENEDNIKRMSDRMQQQRAEEAADNPFDNNFARNAGGDNFLGGYLNNVMSPMGNFFSFIQSMPSLARTYPAFEKLFSLYQGQQMSSAVHQTHFAGLYGDLKKAHGNARIFEASDIIAHLRKTDQKLKYDTSGRLVIEKDGKTHVLNAETTAAIKDTNNFWKDVMKRTAEVHRKKLEDFVADGLNSRSSLADISQVIKDYDSAIKGNPIALVRQDLIARKETLENLKDKISEFNNITVGDEPYVPFMRFGDYVIQIVDRQNANKTVHLEAINDRTFLNLATRLPSEKDARNFLQKKGLDKKYGDRSRYSFNHFQMTHGKVADMIRKNSVSTELIQSLMASGIRRQMDLAEHFATGYENQREFLKGLSKNVEENENRINKLAMSRGFGRFHLKSENIDGHSTDWGRVYDEVLKLYSNSLGQFEYAKKMSKAQAAIYTDQGIHDKMRTKLQRYVDYMNSPGNDHAGLRQFNFIWAMGLNPASAALQLMTLPMQTMGKMIEWNGNVPHNAVKLAWAFKNSAARMLGRPDSYSAELKKILDNPRVGTILRASIKDDALRSLRTANDKVGKVLNNITEGAGFLIQNAEHLTRETAFVSYWHMLQNKNTLKQALKQQQKDNLWQGFWEINKEHFDLETALALYATQENHAVFGRLGRGEAQRGIYGSLILPFATYAQHSAEVMGAQLAGYRGPRGVAGGLWTAGSYIALAGLVGVPAYELWKTLYESYERNVKGRAADLDMDLKEAGVPEALHRGTLSAITGLDLSSRIGQQLIGQQLLIGAIKGEFKLGEVGGVPGRTFEGLMSAASELSNPLSTKTPLEAIAPALPTVARNMLKAIEPDRSFNQTATGKVLQSPESITTGQRVAQGFGVTPLEKTEAREKLYFSQKANQEFNQYKQRLSEALAEGQYRKSLGKEQGDEDMVNQGSQMITRATKEAKDFIRKNKLPDSGKLWSGIVNGAKERYWQKRNPGKIRKPTKDQIRHLEVLMDNE